MLKISFNFDEVTKEVSNIKVISNSSNNNLSQPVLSVLDNKLELSDSAVDLLNAIPNDRVAINYWMVNKSETFPVIGKAEVFTCKDGTLINISKPTTRKQISYPVII